MPKLGNWKLENRTREKDNRKSAIGNQKWLKGAPSLTSNGINFTINCSAYCILRGLDWARGEICLRHEGLNV